jgi:large subunit ribosomal protein L24e
MGLQIEKCWYCSSSVYPGHGITFVRNDCRMFKFCRPKCHKHFKAKHNPRKSKWTKAGRAARGKEMTLDPTFKFEMKRNIPTRYDRNLWIQTVQAIKKIDKIRQVRKLRFHHKRLAEQAKAHKSAAQKELSKNSDLIASVRKTGMKNLNPVKLVKKVAVKEKVERMEE